MTDSPLVFPLWLTHNACISTIIYILQRPAMPILIRHSKTSLNVVYTWLQMKAWYYMHKIIPLSYKPEEQ